MADVEIDTNVKDFTNRNNFGIIVCTSGTRPTAVDGKFIYETDTDKFLHYNGATWVEITGGGVTDHGALTGLTDDDHTQYVLVDGTRTMTGDLTINKVGPKVILEPTDSDSPALILEDTASNYKGRVYVTGDDMVVLGEDGELYLSTAVTTGGNVLLETKGVTRLTVADAGLTSTVPLAMGSQKITGLAAGATNGDALRYEQIADASFINLLSNGNFESWSAGASSAPNGWGVSGTGVAVAREGTTIKLNTYSTKLTRSGADCALYYAHSDYANFKSKTVTLGMWVYASNASTARLYITDGISPTEYSSYHSGGSSWEWLTVTHTLASNATGLWLHGEIDNNDVAVYFDGAILVEGSICPEFSPKPLVDDGKSIQIDSTTNAVIIGGSLSMDTHKITNVVDPTANQEVATKKYVDDTAGISDHSLLSNLTWSTAGHTINANIDMNDNNITEANEIQATASQNLTLKVSTGSSIVFQAV